MGDVMFSLMFFRHLLTLAVQAESNQKYISPSGPALVTYDRGFYALCQWTSLGGLMDGPRHMPEARILFPLFPPPKVTSRYRMAFLALRLLA